MLQVILGVIKCISNFQKPCVLKTAGFRVKDNLDLCVIQFYGVIVVFHRDKQSSKPLDFLSLTWNHMGIKI